MLHTDLIERKIVLLTNFQQNLCADNVPGGAVTFQSNLVVTGAEVTSLQPETTKTDQSGREEKEFKKKIRQR